jgi:hypothetical protein
VLSGYNSEAMRVEIEWGGEGEHVASLRDITDCKQMEVSLLKSEKLQTI